MKLSRTKITQAHKAALTWLIEHRGQEVDWPVRRILYQRGPDGLHRGWHSKRSYASDVAKARCSIQSNGPGMGFVSGEMTVISFWTDYHLRRSRLVPCLPDVATSSEFDPNNIGDARKHFMSSIVQRQGQAQFQSPPPLRSLALSSAPATAEAEHS